MRCWTALVVAFWRTDSAVPLSEHSTDIGAATFTNSAQRKSVHFPPKLRCPNGSEANEGRFEGGMPESREIIGLVPNPPLSLEGKHLVLGCPSSAHKMPISRN
jgi:hypothetical protein